MLATSGNKHHSPSFTTTGRLLWLRFRRENVCKVGCEVSAAVILDGTGQHGRDSISGVFRPSQGHRRVPRSSDPSAHCSWRGEQGSTGSPTTETQHRKPSQRLQSKRPATRYAYIFISSGCLKTGHAHKLQLCLFFSHGSIVSSWNHPTHQTGVRRAEINAMFG